jgi:hypothetical protein
MEFSHLRMRITKNGEIRQGIQPPKVSAFLIGNHLTASRTPRGARREKTNTAPELLRRGRMILATFWQ